MKTTRAKRPKSSNVGGRPTVFTQDVVAKLEQAFAIDCTVEEACSYADISRDAFYDYLKREPKFSDRIADLRNRPILKARQTIVTKLGESYSNSIDYLKRKRPTEFADKPDPMGTVINFNFFDEDRLRKIAARTVNGGTEGQKSLS